MAFACIDIGGTNTVIGAGNESGDAFTVADTVRTKEFLTDMLGMVRTALDEAGYSIGQVDEVAIAGAGMIDRDTGVFRPPNIDRDAVQVVAPFRSLDMDVTLLNDCGAAVLGEYVYGEDRASSMVYLTISTGIGAGVIVDGHRLQGRDGNVGEVGHLVVGDDGLSCGCGGTDHWEAYCSGANLPQMAEALFGYTFADAPAIFAAYQDGEDRAREVVQCMQEYNVRGVTNVIHAFDPELVTIGGGVALNHESVVVDDIRKRVAALNITSPQIKPCSLREQAVVHGLRAHCMGRS